MLGTRGNPRYWQGMHRLMTDEGEGDYVVMTLVFDDGNWIGGGVMPPMTVVLCSEHDVLAAAAVTSSLFVLAVVVV